MRLDERDHRLRGALGDLAQHPADGLADEELALDEHRLGIAQEAPPMRVAPPQRGEEGEHGRPPKPEIRVGTPAIERAQSGARLAPHRRHVDAQKVEVTLEIALLLRRPARRTEGREALLERRDLARGGERAARPQVSDRVPAEALEIDPAGRVEDHSLLEQQMTLEALTGSDEILARSAA